MKTIKTGPPFRTSKYIGNDEFFVMCELDHDISCMVRTFDNREEADNLVARLNVAAYRWAISEND